MAIRGFSQAFGEFYENVYLPDHAAPTFIRFARDDLAKLRDGRDPGQARLLRKRPLHRQRSRPRPRPAVASVTSLPYVATVTCAFQVA